MLRCVLVARKKNLTGVSTGLTGRSKNLDPTGAGRLNLFPSLIIDVARIFDWGVAQNHKITSNDVIRNFKRGIFLWEQRYRRMEDQKPWPGVST